MFGLKIFKEAKANQLNKDKKRKQYYAIKNYYKKKAEQENTKTKNK